MDGFDEKWHTCDSGPRATYTNLDPGTYIFRVMGSNNDGVWNKDGMAITIEIVPPYWQTLWFKTLIATFLLGAVFLLDKIRVNRIKSQKEKLQELVNERTDQLQKANKELERLAKEDGLTKIANRRTFQYYLEMEWKRAKREKRPLSLIMADVDLFKLYNDTYGHQAGDNCLIKIAQILKDTINRPGDFIARYGGEEFTIVLLNTDIRGATHVAKEVKQNVINCHIPFRNSSVKNVVTVSLGVSTLIPSDKSNSTELISFADKALYRAKEEGRNRIHIYNTDQTIN